MACMGVALKLGVLGRAIPRVRSTCLEASSSYLALLMSFSSLLSRTGGEVAVVKLPL